MKNHKTEWIQVTPIIASRWLETKAPNRVLNENLALEYAIAMEHGEWSRTHQGIAFDDKGRLVDGQHRLHAITLAKVPVWLQVTRGLTKEDVMVIDHGRSRTPADSLSIFRGVRVDSKTCAIANRVIQISPYYAALNGKTQGQHWKPTTLQLDEFLRKHETAMIRATEIRRRSSVHGISSAMLGAIIFRAYYHVPEKRLTALIDLLVTGHYDDEAKDSVGLLLRNHLISRRDGWRGIELADHYHMERAVWGFWKGESLARIYPTTEELFPLPEEKSGAVDFTTIVPATIRRLRESRVERAAHISKRRFSKDTL